MSEDSEFPRTIDHALTPEAKAKAVRNRTDATRETLTPKQELFCLYLVGVSKGNAADAARRAGAATNSAHNTAKRWLDLALVQTRLRELMENVAQVSDFTKGQVLQYLQTIVVGAKPTDQVRALELVAKMQGFFAPTRSIRTNIHQVSVDRPYAELLATLQEYRDDLTDDSRRALESQLHGDMALIRDCLKLLKQKDEPPALMPGLTLLGGGDGGGSGTGPSSGH